MACLRDILSLFRGRQNPFYAGFGNRFTDALSYRSVNIPSIRIFTINSNAEVCLDALSLNKYKSSYVTMRELVDHFFPPVATLVQEGGEDFTDFNYWRDVPCDLENFSATDSEDESELEADDSLSDGEDSEAYDDDKHTEELGESYISKESVDNVGDMADSIIGSVPEDQASASDIDDQEDLLEDGRQSKEDIQLRVLDASAKSSGSVTSNMLDEQLEESDILHARQPAGTRLVLR